MQREFWPVDPKLSHLTDGDLRLIEAIQRLQCLSPDGRVRSLFRVSLEAHLDYPWAHNRLARLEELSYVRVRRFGPGIPLEISLC
jgi:hypothetical protein